MIMFQQTLQFLAILCFVITNKLMWGLLVKDKNTMCTRKELKNSFILITYENINMKWKKQGYGARSYFKLVFNKFKVMKETSYIYICLET